MTTSSAPVEIYCLKCRAKTGSRDIEGRHHEERPPRHPAPSAPSVAPKSSAPASCPDWLAHPILMALDLGLTTRQLLSAMDGVADAVRDHGDRLGQTLERARSVPRRRGRLPHRRSGPAVPTSPPAPAPRDCWAASRRRRFPRTGPPSPWTAPTSTWTATCPCAAT